MWAPRRYTSNAWRPAPAPMSSTRSPGLSPRRLKSTVSMVGVRPLLLGQTGAVLLDRLLGGVLPAPVVDDPLAAGLAHLGADGLVVQDVGDLDGERLAVAGRDEEGGLVVGADHLGHGATGGGDQRDGAAHGFDGGEGEALVQRRHHGDLGLGVQ